MKGTDRRGELWRALCMMKGFASHCRPKMLTQVETNNPIILRIGPHDYVKELQTGASDDLTGDAKAAISSIEAKAAEQMSAGSGKKGKGKRGAARGQGGPGKKGKAPEGHVTNRKDPSGRGGLSGDRGKRGKAAGGGKARKGR
eukprot:gene6875-30849_t